MTKHQEDIVFGRQAAEATLRSDRDINKVFVQEGSVTRNIRDIIKLAKGRKAQIIEVPKSKLDQLSQEGNHQGVVVAVSAMAYAQVDDLFQVAADRKEDPFFVILDGIEDPHNLGSILRTADAAGVHGIIIPKHRAVGLTPTVAKVSTGAIERVKVARVTNLVETIHQLQERGVWVFGTDMEGENYQTWNTAGPIAIVIGNEGKGISRLVKENVDGMVTIPMKGQIQSLNASVAAALLIYEVYRERD